jgi:hypothetical protein
MEFESRPTERDKGIKLNLLRSYPPTTGKLKPIGKSKVIPRPSQIRI